jgi:hypothetical protein
LGLFVLGVVLLAVSNLFFTSTREIRTGGVDGLLVSSARAQLEALRQDPFDGNLPGGSLTDPLDGYWDIAEPAEGRRVMLLWEIQTTDSPSMKQISVRAVPLQGQGLNSGRPREVLLTTLRSRTSDPTS